MDPRFLLADEAGFRAWLAKAPRAVVLMRGVGCPFSAAFEAAFRETRVPDGWARCVREVEEGGWGAVAEALAVERTPTLVAFADGAETSRLEARLALGITRPMYRKWLATL